MKGTSTLHVTEATIIAAVQMYLDDQFAVGKSPVVTGVKPRNGVGNGDGYSVTVEERALTPRDILGKPRPLPHNAVPLDDVYNKRMVGGERNDG